MAALRVAFVAHKYEDAAVVQLLAASILGSALGWRFEEVVPLSEGWKPLADVAIDTADAFVLLATEESLASKNCEYEWKRATRFDKPILVIAFEGSLLSSLPAGLQDAPAVTIAKQHPEAAASAVSGALNELVTGRDPDATKDLSNPRD